MLQIESVTEEEKQAIEELKQRIIKDLKPRHRQDETLYYRFLKARDFKVKDAEALFRQHLADIELYNGETLLETFTATKEMDAYMGNTFLGYDKDGSPVRYIDFGESDTRGLFQIYNFRDFVDYNAYQMEMDINRMTQQTIKLGKQVTKVALILNMENLSLYQVTHKKGLDLVFNASKLLQNNYPERIKKIYIINAAFYFNMGFKIIKTVLAGPVLEKIHIFGKTGWHEALLNDIDADVLPAFLGGNKTDPDGNPRCNSFVNHPVKVPEMLYLKNKKKSIKHEADVKKLTVTPFSTTEIEFQINEPDTKIEWEFETKNKDIAFGLYFKSDSNKHSKLKELIPKQRIDTMLASEIGLYNCDKTGTYIIQFDNSYSWIYSKEIFYRTRLVQPNKIDNLTNGGS